MTYARLIVNPVAGAGRTAKKWPEIMARLESLDLRFDYDLTEAPGHARELAKSAASKGYELVVSVGGDGTINEVVNGLYDAGNLAEVRLGIISTGTGSDYIRTIGIPRAYHEACHCLKSPRKLAVDIGVVEYWSNGQMVRRLFANFAGLGFDAEIVRTTTQKFKALSGTISYLAGLFSALIFYRNKGTTIAMDGAEIDGKICTILVSNGRYGGGGMLTAPEADLSDGLLDVVIIGDVSKPDLIRSLPRIYKGTHLTHPKVTWKKAQVIEIKSADRVSLQADGELLGELPARFYVLPAALNIVV
ncbi:MAG TPA: diacylglycerol kinase family lipid kinase [Dehalococcoidia bacterium]|nr:diacylglycerol kinase family lipid kinase [Dehalococcoidia bacterium]